MLGPGGVLPIVLNLGCGGKVHPDCVNIDWSIHLRIARNPILKAAIKPFISPQRAAHIDALTSNIVVHDLRKGIPYPDGSVDAVYHSHTLEHIDRDIRNPDKDPAVAFTREIRRVLKPGGVLRIVVPDMERRCRAYVANLAALEAGEAPADSQDVLLDEILGQAVRREAFGTASQRPVLRWVENALLGDARARGHTHMWEYDRFNLPHMLRLAGFTQIKHVDYQASDIPNWNSYGLDVEDGREYKPGSLYFEATR